MTDFRHGSGRLCLDFIRTLRYRGSAGVIEELPDGAALIGWVDQFGPYEGDVAGVSGPAQVAGAQRLREAIHHLITAARGPGGVRACGPAARRRINDAATHPVPVPSLDAGGRTRWAAADPVEAMLAMLARDALDLATSDAIGRIRGCANPDCGALFLDSSRPGTRRWCSMDTCGNLAKKETLRRKADTRA